MKNIKRLLFLCALPALVLSSCGPASTSSSEAQSSSETPTSSSEEPIIRPDTPLPPEEGVPSVRIHYKRNDKKYGKWHLWLWRKGAQGADYYWNGTDDYGVYAHYPLSTWGTGMENDELGFLVRDDAWNKDPEPDRFIPFASLDATEKGVYEVYVKTEDPEIYTDDKGSILTSVTSAYFTSYTELSVNTNVDINKVILYENDEVIETFTLAPENENTFKLKGGKRVDIAKSYKVEVTFSESGNVITYPVSLSPIYLTDEFTSAYHYDGELGAIYTKSSTTFRVWSPVSSKITLNVYENGTGGEARTFEMTQGDKGTYSFTLNEDLHGKYYTYTVINSKYPQGKEVVDPYAKSAGLNGVRGMVVDFTRPEVTPDGWDEVSPLPYDRKSLAVYETHIADVTSSKTWTGTEAKRYKFSGVIEEGTTYTKDNVTVKTGFDHIVELGVNAIQFVPIFDQANEEDKQVFNWGYNPLNYNVVEGIYSEDPTNGLLRIKEFRNVVQAFEAKGINVIMDVVYNHVSSHEGSNFDVLMPGYYFRTNPNGSVSNGSGCGNETASERSMYQKFMIDSSKFWAETYKLGGFRFDLMGLHDIETMNKVDAELKNINPNICVYGEPWTGGSSPLAEDLRAIQANGNSYVGYGQFNDQMRDALIKGGMKGKEELGWITGDKERVEITDTNRIKQGIMGQTLYGSITAIKDPNKTVNYVTCHDNFTLNDRFEAAGITDEELKAKMNVLANSVVFTSQGTTFMLAGEEFLRTKGGDHNSYQSSYEVNELNYELKIAHKDMFKAYQELIKFKTKTGIMALEQAEIKENVRVIADPEVADSFVTIILDKANNVTYKIAHANGLAKETTKVDFEGFDLILDTLNSNASLSKGFTMNPYQTIIAVKKGLVDLPDQL